jgi:phosphatidylglycerol:prolipoprotein diacylglycerol transferase
LTWHQPIYLVALAAAVGVALTEGERRSLYGSRWLLVLGAWILGGFVGAELPSELLGDLVGVRTALGAVAGATLAMFVTARAAGISGARALDATAVALPLGGAVARVGCFVADCCDGITTALPIGVVADDGVIRHPTQLYEAALDLAVAIGVARFRSRVREGHRFLVSLGAMSVGRFVVEFAREGERFGVLTFAQWTVGLAAVFCVALVGLRVRLPEFAIQKRVAATGMTALALQVPLVPADSVYPRKYLTVGAGGTIATVEHIYNNFACEGETWRRKHRFGGGAAEAGFRLQKSATHGWGVRVRGFNVTERAGASFDHQVSGGPIPGQEDYSLPGYTRPHRGIALIGDLEYAYLGLSLGFAQGEFSPWLDIEKHNRPPRAFVPIYAARLGSRRFALEVRNGDEQPLGLPLPDLTVGVSFGIGDRNRGRLAVSNIGPLLSTQHALGGGVEVATMAGLTYTSGAIGGMMFRKSFALPASR